MELKETINVYQKHLDKLNELWRSLWPKSQTRKYKKIRNRNVFPKFLGW